MNDDRSLVKKHFDALVAEASARGIPPDVIGRITLHEVLALWQQTRDWRDIASELEFAGKNLDPDADFEFMRP